MFRVTVSTLHCPSSLLSLFLPLVLLNLWFACLPAVFRTCAGYVAFYMDSPTAINEVVLYGTAVTPTPAPPPPVPHASPMMDTFIGVNGFVDDPVSRLCAAASVREYQDWSWTEGAGDPGFPHALTKFQPTQVSEP